MKALYAALAEFGAPIEELKAEDFMEPGMFFRMGAWERRTDMEIDPEDGLTAPVISRGDLIAAKLAAVRPQDLIDVAALRQTERQTAQMNAEEETGAEEIKKRRRREPE